MQLAPQPACRSRWPARRLPERAGLSRVGFGRAPVTVGLYAFSAYAQLVGWQTCSSWRRCRAFQAFDRGNKINFRPLHPNAIRHLPPGFEDRVTPKPAIGNGGGFLLCRREKREPRQCFGICAPLGLPLRLGDHRQILGGGFHLGTLVMCWRTIGVRVLAKKPERADMLDKPSVLTTVDRLPAEATRRDMVRRATVREDVMPALGRHRLSRGGGGHAASALAISQVP